MKVEQFVWNKDTEWGSKSPYDNGLNYDLALIFSSREILQEAGLVDELLSRLEGVTAIGCSTAGEIYGDNVVDDSFNVTLVKFENTELRQVHYELEDQSESFKAGEYLAKELATDGLAHILVISEGVEINGDELVRGLTSSLPDGVNVTGGLSGDGDQFQETLVISGNNVGSNIVSAIGFYGPSLRVGYASLGGWDPFGPERLVTKSDSNVLYELDGKPALDLYKTYLGEHASGLPATGLLFPLSIRTNKDNQGIVRTILGVDESNGSMTFAGNMPEGSYVRLMKANFDRLIDGAVGAAENCLAVDSPEFKPELALLISCVGRKMILKQRIEEEVEGVRDIFGADTVFTGFYSYGEISPIVQRTVCELHNQTMTITAFSEV